MSDRWCSNTPRDVATSLIQLARLARMMPHNLVQLDGDSQQNLKTWDTALRDLLSMEALEVHLDSDMPEPDENNWGIWQIWNLGRGVAKYVVCKTLQKPHIRERLHTHGWDYDNQSPKYHYDIARELWGHLVLA